MFRPLRFQRLGGRCRRHARDRGLSTWRRRGRVTQDVVRARRAGRAAFFVTFVFFGAVLRLGGAGFLARLLAGLLGGGLRPEARFAAAGEGATGGRAWRGW